MREAHLGPGWAAAIAATLLAYGLLCASAAATGDLETLAILSVIPVLPVVAFVGLRGVLGRPAEAFLVAVFIIFICAANFRVREYADKSIDFQVALKLLVLFLAAGIACLHMGRLVRYASANLAAWLALFGVLFASALYARGVPLAAFSSASFAIVFAYCFYLAVAFGRLRTVEIMIVVVLIMSLASLAVYWLLPSLGRMQAWTGEEFGTIGRLRGITGSANSIGSTAAFGILLSVMYLRELTGPWRQITLATIAAAGLCVILSDNRMAVGALVVSLWFWYVLKGQVAAKAVLSFCLGVAAVAGLLVFSDTIFSVLSRSGDASEITSATGRSAIWSVVLELWWRRPWLGYGYQSALHILPEDPRLFGVAAHAHNMYLEILFSAGLVGLASFLVALVALFRRAIALGAVRESALVIFFLVRGLTEASPFSGVAGYATFAFCLGVVLILTGRRPAVRAVDAAPLPSRLTPLRTAA